MIPQFFCYNRSCRDIEPLKLLAIAKAMSLMSYFDVSVILMHSLEVGNFEKYL